MRKICLVCLAHESCEFANIIETALAELQFDVELIKVPFFRSSELNEDRLSALKKLIQRKALHAFVIFFPDTTELFLHEPDYILAYSGYRSWLSRTKTRVVPHLWVPAGFPANIDDLIWKEKPPLQIGFMGRTYATSRLASFISRFPGFIKTWLLKREPPSTPQTNRPIKCSWSFNYVYE